MNMNYKTQPQLLEGSLIDDEELHRNYSQKSQSDGLPLYSQSQFQEQSRLEQQISDQKKNTSNDKGNISMSRLQDKFTLKIQQIVKDKIVTSLLKPKTQRNITQFICFKDRKLILKNIEIQQFINDKKKANMQDYLKPILCFQILQKVLKRLFFQQNGFQIIQINKASFNMTVCTMQGSLTYEKKINKESLQNIFNYQLIYISRLERASKNNTQSKERKPEEQQIQIISPDLRDFIYHFERNKTFAELKESISIYYYQFVGRIIFINYSNFRIIDINKRICDISDKTFEIYQEKRQEYIDKSFSKINAKVLSLSSERILINSSLECKVKFQQTMISQTLFKGQLFLKIQHNKLIQRFNGGFLGNFVNDRVKIRSLLILTGIKIVDKHFYLQFTYKDHKQILLYTFIDAQVLTSMIKIILTITRIFNHKLEMMG